MKNEKKKCNKTKKKHIKCFHPYKMFSLKKIGAVNTLLERSWQTFYN